MSDGAPRRATAARPRGAVAVAVGILASRLAGLVRQKVFAWFLGAGDAADAFNQAFRIPNLLQNLFGEGVLSASFIPVYARLRAAGDDDQRQEVAGAVLGILALGVAALVLLGVLVAPAIVRVIVPGFDGAQRDLTVQLVRILFPGAGLLVLSAWCLGVLNSHGRFLLSYASPVVWNAAMIAALLGWGGGVSPERLAVLVAWGSVVGSALQVAIQWPAVRGVLGHLRLSFAARSAAARQVLRNFWPAFVSRGINQLSAFVDVSAASFLSVGSATMLNNAQTLYMLPASLFGMSVSAASLPDMAGDAGHAAEGRARLRARLDANLQQVAFFVIPSCVALAVLGDLIVGAVFLGGAFGSTQVQWLQLVVASASVGLLGATLGRLYATTLFALQDTRTPQRFALVRAALGVSVGLTLAFLVAPWLKLPPESGAALLVLGSGVGAWTEWWLLRQDVSRRLGGGGSWGGDLMRTWGAAFLAAAVVRATIIGMALPSFAEGMGQVAVRVALLALYGGVFVGVAHVLGLAGARALLGRLGRG